MLLETNQLTLSLGGRPILNGVDLHMEPGDIYGLLGPNGAGKSTTISVLTGLRRATSGKVTVLGHDPARHRAELHHEIGVLPEKAGFYDWMSAADYLRWFARLYGLHLEAREVREQLGQVGLDAADRRPIGAYSRGMRQRLGLARALFNRPRLLVLDEPTNGLDPRGRREIHDVLRELSVWQGVGILLCTHLLDDVERLCTRVGILHQGRTMVEGPLSGLLSATESATRYRVRLGADLAQNGLPKGVRVVEKVGEWLRIEIPADWQPDVVWHALFTAGWPITEIHRDAGGLESLYLSNTETEAAA